MAIATEEVSILPVLLATFRMDGLPFPPIPNWLTVPGALLGIAANWWLRGWPGAKDSLLGASPDSLNEARLAELRVRPTVGLWFRRY